MPKVWCGKDHSRALIHRIGGPQKGGRKRNEGV